MSYIAPVCAPQGIKEMDKLTVDEDKRLDPHVCSPSLSGRLLAVKERVHTFNVGFVNIARVSQKKTCFKLR